MASARPLLILPLLLVAACPTQGAGQRPKEPAMLTDADRKIIEDFGHLRLPPGATQVHFHTEKGADTALWLRLELPCQERAVLLDQAGFPQGVALSAMRRSLRDYLRKDLPWWRPDSIDPFESGEHRQEQGRRFASNVLLSRGGGDTCTAYLFVTSL